MPILQFMEKIRLAVFCGSSPGKNGKFREAAQAMARLMAQRNIGVVFGGGKVGLMGIVADEALAYGGEVIGIIPEKLKTKEVAHNTLTRLEVVQTMHERKARMAELSSGFIALPGGIGTLEEIIEVFTWHQIGYHDKPCAFLNVDGYYDPLFSFLDRMVSEGFLSSRQRAELIIENDQDRLLDRM